MVKDLATGHFHDCRIKGKFRLKGIKNTNPIAVGDRVVFELEEEDRGVITEIHRRDNYIIRKSVNLSKQTHIIEIGRAHVWTPVTIESRMPSSAWKKKVSGLI